MQSKQVVSLVGGVVECASNTLTQSRSVRVSECHCVSLTSAISPPDADFSLPAQLNYLASGEYWGAGWVALYWINRRRVKLCYSPWL